MSWLPGCDVYVLQRADVQGGFIYQHYRVPDLTDPASFNLARDYQYVGEIQRLDWMRLLRRAAM